MRTRVGCPAETTPGYNRQSPQRSFADASPSYHATRSTHMNQTVTRWCVRSPPWVRRRGVGRAPDGAVHEIPSQPIALASRKPPFHLRENSVLALLSRNELALVFRRVRTPADITPLEIARCVLSCSDTTDINWIFIRGLAVKPLLKTTRMHPRKIRKHSLVLSGLSRPLSTGLS